MFIMTRTAEGINRTPFAVNVENVFRRPWCLGRPWTRAVASLGFLRALSFAVG
jgi:hypothetical protein